jgi:hypothetical protein
VFGGNGESFLGVLLRHPRFAAELMQNRRKAHGVCNTVGFG